MAVVSQSSGATSGLVSNRICRLTDRVNITDAMDKVPEMSQLFITGKFVFRIDDQ